MNIHKLDNEQIQVLWDKATAIAERNPERPGIWDVVVRIEQEIVKRDLPNGD